jgi:hypothetical protein
MLRWEWGKTVEKRKAAGSGTADPAGVPGAGVGEKRPCPDKGGAGKDGQTTDAVSHTETTPTPEPTPSPTPGPYSDKPDIDITSWEYLLANAKNPIGDYAPELGTLEGQQFDKRIIDAMTDLSPPPEPRG